MLLCPRCQSGIPDTQEKCPTCGHHAGPPNVRAANLQNEVRALDERYQAALENARTRGCLAVAERLFESANRSSAVINVDARFLYHFAASRNSLYANYEHLVAGNVRKPGTFENDAARRSVGTTLFGAYSGDIIYAALSLTGLGLDSYGPYAMTLRDIAINQRATVLESNSFDFVKKHQLLGGNQRPAGCFATWGDRNKLAVAKLEASLTPQTTDDDFQHLLLSTSGNRATDEYIEVQIYGPFDLGAVECVRGSSKAGSKEERSLLKLAKQYLKNAGISWIEHD
jgi:hypothetical protein